MKPHQCPVKGCKVIVDAKKLMCGHHWALCPRKQRSDVWAHYRTGQERRGDPSPAYYAAARAAIAAVETIESGDAAAAAQMQLI